MEFLVFFGAAGLLGLLALRYGADSRDGCDWNRCVSTSRCIAC